MNPEGEPVARIQVEATLTPETAWIAAQWLLGFHECISNDDLAEACERAAKLLLTVQAPTTFTVYNEPVGSLKIADLALPVMDPPSAVG